MNPSSKGQESPLAPFKRPADPRKTVQLAERFREEISWILLQEVRDPRIEGVLVTAVVMQPDRHSVHVYVRKLGMQEMASRPLPVPLQARHKGGKPKGRKHTSLEDPRYAELLQALRGASGLLRREMGQRLALRYTPELRFFYDTKLEEQLRIDAILAESPASLKP